MDTVAADYVWVDGHDTVAAALDTRQERVEALLDASFTGFFALLVQHLLDVENSAVAAFLQICIVGALSATLGVVRSILEL